MHSPASCLDWCKGRMVRGKGELGEVGHGEREEEADERLWEKSQCCPSLRFPYSFGAEIK